MLPVLILATLCWSITGCGRATSKATATTSVRSSTTRSTSQACQLVRELVNAPDSDKTQLIRDLAATPEAAPFAQTLILFANLRDVSRGIPSSTSPGGLTLQDPAVQRQTAQLEKFAHDQCGVSKDLLH